MRKAKKPIPIGISDFRELIEGGYAYVDKTLFIQKLLEEGTEVALIPRMRRFGKTLNLSMLRYFFEKTKTDTGYLFKDLAIWKNKECRALQGKYPVIFLSLKDIKHASWKKTFESLQRVLAKEFQRHNYLLKGKTLGEEEKEDYFAIVRKESSQTLLEQSLQILSEWLHRYYKKRVILLIDEYDTPAHAAYMGGYCIPGLRKKF